MILRILSYGVFMMLAATPVRAEVLIFAAASLKGPVDQIADRFDNVVVSYGGSGTLARQISLGAPADIVLLANNDWMDVLLDGGQVVPESVTNFASNRLVLITGQNDTTVTLEPAPFLAALGEGRIAVGLTEAVPAGIYAKASLQSLGLWELTKDQLAEVDNVRAALMLVARGQTPLGIVYQTDVHVSDAVTEAAVFPAESHPPIQYLGALTHHANAEAKTVLDFISEPEGQTTFAGFGFLPPIEAAQ